jgi:proteasome lid subunit RPN8/RPN11
MANFEVSGETVKAIEQHATVDQNVECCGLIGVKDEIQIYFPCRNTKEHVINSKSNENEVFSIDEDDYANAEDSCDRIVAVVHSHPGKSPNPSQADLVSCEASGLPWVIIGLPSLDIKIIEPSGYKAPLEGREFFHGVLDCYSLCQDYYAWELGIQLPHFERPDNWWEEKDGVIPSSLYMDNFEKAGFRIIDTPPKKNDGLIIQYAAKVANHAAVYLGDEIMLHHLMRQLSRKTVYGGYWLKNTIAVVRHNSFPD